MKRCLISLFFFNSALIAFPQVETKYYSTPQQSEKLSMVKGIAEQGREYKMPPFDLEELLREDSIFANTDAPQRFGKAFDVSISLEDGDWITLKNGRVWTLTIESEKAISLNFILEEFFLPDGATLEIISDTGTTFYGPVTAKSIPKNGFFLTDRIMGNRAIFYLYEPEGIAGKSNLRITRVVHGYRGLNGEVGNARLDNSSVCNVDVDCHPEYSEESKAVASVLLSSATAWGSGSLIMDTKLSFKPYFLTAFHCIDRSPQDGILSSTEINDSQNWLFKFGFKREACDGFSIDTSYTYNGAIFRAGWNNTDFALLELVQDLEENENLFWLGWNRTTATPINGVCIHHPYGDVMKISIEDDPFSTNMWLGPNSSNEYNHWEVNFDEGIAQPCSSGGPLLNQDHQVVGQLHGGPHPTEVCDWTNRSFGKFNLSWSGGGTNDTRLSNWLDPDNYGRTTMLGASPASLSIVGPDIPCGESIYYINNLPTGYYVTWFWRSDSDITIWNSSTPQCTIYNNNHAYINNVLVANIYDYSSGTLLRTLEKEINTGANFSGTYWQSPPSFSTHYTFKSGQILTVNKNKLLTLQSSDFIGATISISGMTPLMWNHLGNTITVGYGSISSSKLGISATTFTGTYADSCSTFQFVVAPITMTATPSFELSTSSIGQTVRITLHEASHPNELSKEATLLKWNLVIVNALSGKEIIDTHVTGATHVINVSQWQPGAYIVQAKVGTEVQTQKISIFPNN